MVTAIVAISLVAAGLIALSVSTLTWAAPWAAISIFLAALYSIGKRAEQLEEQDRLAHRICLWFPAIHRIP